MAAPLLVRRFRRWAFLMVGLAPAVAFCWASLQIGTVVAGGAVTERRQWVAGLGLGLDFRLDSLALILTLLVTGVGALVLGYCAWYFDDDEPGLGRMCGVLVAFAGAMLGLVLADNLLLLYSFWELTTVFSYLLIGHQEQARASRHAALQALMVTAFGGLAMLVGLIVLGTSAGTYRISEIVGAPPSGTAVTVALVLILLGAATKSALVPFHFWLPAAMAAPTPISAYLHAAAMVKAGVYLVALLAPAFATATPWRPIVLVFGAATMLLGGWRALTQHDLKLLLAYGTVSQLGFLFVVVGVGTRTAALAGAAMILAHGLFKAALFLIVGAVDHAAGTRDLRELTGLRTRMPVAFWAAAVSAASMAGVFPLLGFVSKESAFDAFLGGDVGGVGAAVLTALVIGSALTAAYSWRLVWGAFGNKPGVAEPVVYAAPVGLLVGPVLLSALSVVLGLGTKWVDALAQPYAAAYPIAAGQEAPHLALWHGISGPLLLSAVALGVGAVLAWRRVRVEATQARLRDALHLTAFDAARGYRRIIHGLDRLAVEVTGATQRGSLPVYLVTVLVTTVTLVVVAVVRSGWQPTTARLWDTPVQLIVTVLMLAAAVAMIRVSHRLAAVVLSGAIGYGTAMLFVLGGAPDLALTQVLVETITLVVFVLALRRLPRRFPRSRSPRWRKALHAGVAISIGAITVVATYTAMTARTAPSVSEQFAAAAQLGGGANIVNVALVDFRAWDTMGEISVLTVAAIGVTSLVFVTRRRLRLPRVESSAEVPQVWQSTEPADEPPAGEPAATWLAGGRTLAPQGRSIMFEVAARLLFRPMLLVSILLLFTGHNATGGGFAGGLVAGLALVMRYLAGGRYELGEAAPIGPGTLMGLGLLLAAGTGVAGVIFGQYVLHATVIDFALPLIGDVHFATATFFDTGVYLVVVGLVLDLLRAFGAELDRQVEEQDTLTGDGGSAPAATQAATG